MGLYSTVAFQYHECHRCENILPVRALDKKGNITIEGKNERGSCFNAKWTIPSDVKRKMNTEEKYCSLFYYFDRKTSEPQG